MEWRKRGTYHEKPKGKSVFFTKLVAWRDICAIVLRTVYRPMASNAAYLMEVKMTKKAYTIEDLRPGHYKRACEILNRTYDSDLWEYRRHMRNRALQAVALHVAETEDFPDKTAEKFEDAWSEVFPEAPNAWINTALTALRKADLIKEVE